MKIRRPFTTRFSTRRPAGVALVIAVLVLVVLSSLLAALAVRVTMVKRRQAYLVEYQRARYALDSAMKYAVAIMPTRNFTMRSRVDMPDFSDLFVMNGEQYRSFLEAWAATATDEQIQKVLKDNASVTTTQPLSPAEMLSSLANIFGGLTGDPNLLPIEPAAWETVVEIDPNDFDVPGPYGPPWPYVIQPIQFQIGPAKVTITIEDENAKMPLAWAITNRQAVNKQAEVALTIFCDWMDMSKAQREDLQDQLEKIYDLKMFELNPNPIMLPQQRAAAPAAQARSAAQARPAGQITTTRTTPAQRTAAQPQAQTQQRPAVAHATDFAKLFHSALLDREPLARPVAHTALPDESPLKYMALWGSQRINVNTAPRHVLEAAFSFGMADPSQLVEQIIRKRQEAPIKTIDELKDAYYGDSLAIERAKDYLATTSNFFLIRVVSQSGNARVSAAATVIKEGRNVERLAILYGL